jgi:hypothetical protein
MAGVERPFAAASQHEDGASLGPFGERDHGHGPACLVAERKRGHAATLRAAAPFTAVGFARRPAVLVILI